MRGPHDFLVVGLEPDLDDDDLTRVYLEDRSLGIYVVVYPDGKAEIEGHMANIQPLYLVIPPEVPRYCDDDD